MKRRGLGCRWAGALAFLLSAAVLVGCGGRGGRMGSPPALVQDTTLGAGDVFEVRVYGEDDLSTEYRVSQDGSIDFPFVGRVSVAGLEPTEVSDLLETKLREGAYLNSPQISILVREYNSKRISVVGAIARPGNFPITAGMTVVEAIGLAGGFSALANQDDTVVTRREAGSLKRYRVPVGEITKGRSPDFPLQAGDIVYVPERLF